MQVSIVIYDGNWTRERKWQSVKQRAHYRPAPLVTSRGSLVKKNAKMNMKMNVKMRIR